MKRIASAVLALVLMLGLAGCGEKAVTISQDAPSESVDDGTAGGSAPAGFDAIPADGANEKAALKGATAAFKTERDSGKWSDVDWAALEKAGPVLVAYVVRVDLGGQIALFEVRADGVAHNIYGYQRAFDSGSIIWTPAEGQKTATAATDSAGEKSAASAVESAMRDAFPEDQFTVSMHAYRFAYIAAGQKPFTFEIGPDGTMLDAGR